MMIAVYRNVRKKYFNSDVYFTSVPYFLHADKVYCVLHAIGFAKYGMVKLVGKHFSRDKRTYVPIFTPYIPPNFNMPSTSTNIPKPHTNIFMLMTIHTNTTFSRNDFASHCPKGYYFGLFCY